MREHIRYARMGFQTEPSKLEESAVNLWTESPAEIRRGLAWGARKRWLLAWVERAMAARLTARERRCVHLYFMQDLTFLEIAKQTGTVGSTACRAVKRGLRKLRLEAERDPSWQAYYRGSRRGGVGRR
ncbi:MAG: hypothetical protein HYV27_06295 [Candidatus Hydrogenedentes bacterium]|nr:hypothetical protein [Candidatus Hydrogenedentota bacterium]